MLTITIPTIESYDENICEFVQSKEQRIQLEHSLVSISKWESKWHRPFLTKDEKTIQESIDYLKCMTITQNVDDSVYERINMDHISEVSRYIKDSMTATTIGSDARKNQTTSREIVTAEIIYYWMVSLNIPFECQKWHLNRLLTLIEVCNIKNQPAKKVGKKEMLSRNQAINAARKSSLNTKG